MKIDTLDAVRLGDTTQWIRIRGEDAANPVLLLVQQGPGLPMINEAPRFDHLLGLEKEFTVVYWDQRGCGRSLRGDADVTIGPDGERHGVAPATSPRPIQQEVICLGVLLRRHDQHICHRTFAHTSWRHWWP